MNNLSRRIERLEQRLSAQHGEQQLVYVGPNLESDDSEETPWSVKIAPGVWAMAFGARFTAEQIDALRKEYALRGC